ncbi:MAG: hypothetical protein JNN05_06130 [Candidatus Omnitrophica bacterium]|nr:hypothetical protein [Candidatus Omnitrophota bacterium]
MESAEVMSKKYENITADGLRQEILVHTKGFKTSWISLGQALYQVWRDKLYHGWGFEEFEHYIVQELGMRKQTAMKLVKTYFFVEQEEPAYLKEEYRDSREATVVPSHEQLDVLRKAKQKKEITRDDYAQLRKNVFEKGKHEGLVRKELTAMIKERKEVDPEEEREKRNEASVKRVITALRSFKKDMETLKLVPQEIVDEAEFLIKKLEREAV